MAVQIISSLLVALQVYLLYKQLKESNKWNKIQASIAMVNRYNILINEIDDALLDEIKLLSFENKDFSLDEIKRIFDNLPNRKQLFLLCDFFEELAIGIKFKYLEEEILFSQLYTPTVRNFYNLHGYIQIRRMETKVNVCGNFEWLANHWKNRETHN